MPKEKELIIRISEAEKELVESVNSILQKHQLPFFLFEPIISNVHRQITDGKVSELEAAKIREMSKEVGDTDG